MNRNIVKALALALLPAAILTFTACATKMEGVGQKRQREAEGDAGFS